jgi:hypothetical protein
MKQLQFGDAEGTLGAVALPQPPWQDDAVRFRKVTLSSPTVGLKVMTVQVIRVI